MTSYEPTDHVSCIARSEVQMETGEEFLNFHLIGNWNKSQDHIKISQFTKFEVL